MTIQLDHAYRDCRRVAAAHGRTYFLATRLLEPERRPAVHALYAFARMVDDIVDAADAPAHAEESAAQLDRIEYELRGHLARIPARLPRAGSGRAGHTTPDHAPSITLDRPSSAAQDRVLLAVSDTIRRYSIAAEHFWVFLDSMRMDIPGSPQYRDRYPSMAALREYMRGSAAAIGLQLLPVLGTVVPREDAEPAAAALGEAFQLTNFLRDTAEDLDRGRIYLPADELAAFDVDADLLQHCRRTGHTDPRVRRALAHLIAVNRGIYRFATPGIELLSPRVRPAIRTAAILYGGILDEIEHADYAIFTCRAVVPQHRRLRIAAKEFAAAHPLLRRAD
ncbi:phytoene/squalene synthase family protein [Nocardia huaxiensis]|uniref:Phytoene/squalene synthase family protein n=1 Tax=Nocardia huaxiensis TaxID=2755382 RepID=A0A7D6Z5M4_9NOCA|nr:phytoene/squalene synthase family protein [Nocardia huaxiensis]QLY33606.1 phytoene/squalene synthase family protein [Nocardia huaxiensis]UFS99476.1 phytoene/squalene synthase family protein [Nocardia huaxiensis]